MQDILDELEHRLLNLPELQKFPEGLYAPMRYMIRLPAKRIRPLLCLLSYRTKEQEFTNSIYDLAIAIELFHNFTLIHDDIMDHADLRRGLPTVHKKYDTNTAILAGDNLLVLVYQKIAHAYPENAFNLIDFFSKAAIEVCEGQMYDLLLSQQEQVTIEEYLQMIRRKTAALLGASMGLGAMAANYPNEIVQKFYQIGEFMGMGFQLQDDYMDVFADEQFGKRIGGDILENKKTFLLISALQDAIGSDYDDLIYWLKTHHQPEKKIYAVKSIFERTGAAEKCIQTSNTYFQYAYQILNELQEYGNMNQLISFLQTIQNRKK